LSCLRGSSIHIRKRGLMQACQYNKKEAPACDYFHGNESFINVRLWKSKSATPLIQERKLQQRQTVAK
jgi:hypothetical protein